MSTLSSLPQNHESKCDGCKSVPRMWVGCTFIRCGIQRKNVEFCWQCEENSTCSKWANHREMGQHRNSFVCYQKLEDNIHFIQTKSVEDFEKEQLIREDLLKEMLQEFNEGRSKTRYCIAATVLEIDELKHAIGNAKQQSEGFGIKKKVKILRQILDSIATKKKYCLRLRKGRNG